MDLQTWLTFVLASTALLMIPGPTVILVLSYALSQGRRVALATVAGVALGDLTAMSLSLAGLGALVLASATLFTVLKWIGAVYLVYLGVQLIRGADGMRLGLPAATGRRAASGVFRHAVVVTALNPKSIAFFIAFVPQFVASGAPILPQFAILTGTFVALAAINALLYALIADGMRARIGQPVFLAWLARGGGAALVTMGVLMATLRRA